MKKGYRVYFNPTTWLWEYDKQESVIKHISDTNCEDWYKDVKQAKLAAEENNANLVSDFKTIWRPKYIDKDNVHEIHICKKCKSLFRFSYREWLSLVEVFISHKCPNCRRKNKSTHIFYKKRRKIIYG